MNRAVPAVLSVLMCVVSGCEGRVVVPNFGADLPPGVALGNTTNSALPGGVDPISTDVHAIIESPVCKTQSVGVRAPLRALTPLQFSRSVAVLFDGHVSAPAGYPSLVGASLTGFSTDAALNTLSGGFAEGVNGVAETIALSVMNNLGSILPCAAKADRACAEQFVDTYATRAFRRPLPADERSALLALFDDAIKSHGDFAVAIAELTADILQHPLFVYLPEIGTPEAGQLKLDDYEIATRLSYLLWNAPPDGELLRAASQGELGSLDGLTAQSRRMLDDARFSEVLSGFVHEWLALEDIAVGAKDTSKFPEFDAQLAGSIAEELRRFVGAAVSRGAGGFAALMAGRDTFVDADLGALYGVANATSFRDWTPVTLGEGRSGILARAALLANFAGPVEPSHVRRGKVVRTALLCDRMLPPPPGATTMQPSYPAAADTRRKRSAILQQTSPCMGCHVQMDPIGLAFDDFDALGRHLGDAVDVSGNILGSDDIAGDFNGSHELAQQLSTSEQAMECMGRQWFRYAFGRIEESADACSFATSAVDLGHSGGDLRSLFASAALAPGFRFRKPTEN